MSITCLLTGSVPPFYRDVYDALCPAQNNEIAQSVVAKVLTKSGLEKGVLSQVNFIHF